MMRILLALIFCFALAGTESSFGQKKYSDEKKKLEEKKKKLQQEIEYKKKLLDEVKTNKKKSMTDLAILRLSISQREELISTINSEITVIGSRIEENKSEIKNKESELQKLKNEYAQMIYFAFKNRNSYDRLMFVFASKDFSQAYARLKYMQQYSIYRQAQALKIEGKKKQLKNTVSDLETKKSEQNNLLSNKEQEKQKLAREKKDKEVALTDLQKKEKKLKGELKKKQEAQAKLKSAIEKLVQKEIDKPKSKLKPGQKNYVISLTPEEQIISDKFSDNQGKLPWPISEGVITEQFGRHEHPDFPDIFTVNNGVDIRTNKGADARSVFEGTVSQIANVPGIAGKIIIIKHGEFLSVYQGIEQSYVRAGDKVKTKQAIGKIITDDDNKSELHLEIWKGKNAIDPEGWIAKGN